MRAPLLALTVLAAASGGLQAQAGPAQGSPTGRIAGRVIDASTAKPLPSARIAVLGQAGVVETDLDGRFRTEAVATGLRSIRVALIGYKPAQIDSIKVVAGQTAVVTVALGQAPVQLQELKVSTDAPTKTSNAAGLLATQQAAPAVTDGISAETIAKTPDKDAGAAIARVTGLSLVDNKVVVRGLGERYSTSLLNGVEIASPEPDKKFVPLDAFKANLLESIVASKTATPDKPGDFAGGTVDIQTKEFPENFTFSAGFSQSYNSRSTFKSFPLGPRAFSDKLGFDGMHRSILPNSDPERFGESLSSVWTPAAVKAVPNSSADFSVGGRKDLGSDALGYVLSVSYTNERLYNPDHLSEGGTPIVFQESSDRVDWGGIANLAYRVGANTKLGFKNFYSRGNNQEFRRGAGADIGDGPSLNYQGRFLEKYIGQSQLTGDHYLTGLLKSRFDWKLSYGQAGRADLDNRQLRYIDRGNGYLVSTAIPSYRYNNSLRDKSYTGQIDWGFPFSLTRDQGGEFKIGGNFRRKDRIFSAQGYELVFGPSAGVDLLSLPPEQLLAPENISADLLSYRGAGVLDPYTAREDVRAAYGMVDMDLVKGLRFVGGLRAERWNASLSTGDAPQLYQKTDFLWSGNLTWIVSNQTNLRFAAYRTVVRPDLRELSQGGYAEVVAGINNVGNPALRPSDVTSGDVRLEVYPAPGEVIAISGFYKYFSAPIVTTLVYRGDVQARPDNLDHATSIGAEFEIRKSLGMLAKSLRNVTVGGNLTLIRSRVRFPATFALVTDPNLRFQGQSPYIINASLTYGSEQGKFSASILFNRFGDRILRYGTAADSASGIIPPNLIEQPRSTLDAKVKSALWRRVSVTATGRNLLNKPILFVYDRTQNNLPSLLIGRNQPGVFFALGLTYEY